MNESENVRPTFQAANLEKAQARTWQVLHRLSQQLCEGMTEQDGHQEAKKLFKEFEVEKIWHPSKIRFGTNTLKSFSENSVSDIRLKKGDPYFLDLGLVFDGHEGDCGQTFVLGENDEAEAMIRAGREVFQEVEVHWRSHQISGRALYIFAAHASLKRGFELNLRGASGHRIGDFPHSVHYRGALNKLESTPTSDRWILEIQLKHPKLLLGAFFEDLLK
jgi:Xaa-Pro aminopeptidase